MTSIEKNSKLEMSLDELVKAELVEGRVNNNEKNRKRRERHTFPQEDTKVQRISHNKSYRNRIICENENTKVGNTQKDRNIYIPENNIYTPENNLYMRENNIYMRENNIYMRENNIYMREKDVFVPRGYHQQYNNNSVPVQLQPRPYPVPVVMLTSQSHTHTHTHTHTITYTIKTPPTSVI
eukprot:GHVR01132160.1.p1 GENE.GHVR01132160.1~~GHVR01132160.1.p1  ORF type:complete len:192 (-),score=72.52 GHVR01132160.1:13-555(-)